MNVWQKSAYWDDPVAQSADAYREAQEGDGRLKPRLRHIPIDTEQELLRLFLQDGIGPLTKQEIVDAWGKLRLWSGRRSAALDLAALIRAECTQQTKGARRKI